MERLAMKQESFSRYDIGNMGKSSIIAAGFHFLMKDILLNIRVFPNKYEIWHSNCCKS